MFSECNYALKCCCFDESLSDIGGTLWPRVELMVGSLSSFQYRVLAPVKPSRCPDIDSASLKGEMSKRIIIFRFAQQNLWLSRCPLEQQNERRPHAHGPGPKGRFVCSCGDPRGMQVHAEGDHAEAEHAELGHSAITTFVPAGAPLAHTHTHQDTVAGNIRILWQDTVGGRVPETSCAHRSSLHRSDISRPQIYLASSVLPYRTLYKAAVAARWRGYRSWLPLGMPARSDAPVSCVGAKG